MNFRYDINGLRAIAVIAVVLFHFNPSLLGGGFAGVDVFFVISGFLMTSIILRGIERHDFNLIKFYVARANRIIPALAFLCVALLVFGWFYLSPPDYKQLGKHAASSVLFVSNVIFFRESGYFDAGSHEKWLLHTWSLSVEWQFYIVYPIILMILSKLLSFEKLKLFLLGATASMFLVNIYISFNWPDSAYYLLFSRAWEMLFGAIAFVYPLACSEHKKRVMEFSGIAAIIFSYLFVSNEYAWPGYYALIPVIGTYLVIVANVQSSIFTNNTISQALGRWSYSIYLWHWPVVVFGYYFEISNWAYYGVPLSVSLGYVSYKLIESRSFNTQATLAGMLKVRSLQFAACAFVLSGLVFVFKGLEQRLPADSVKVFGQVSSSPYREQCHIGKYRAPDQSCEYFSKDIKWAVFGDSHTVEIAYALAERLDKYNVGLKHFSYTGCSPSYGFDDNYSSCSRWYKESVDYIIGREDIRYVVYNHRYSLALIGEHENLYPNVGVSVPNAKEILESIDKTIRLLAESKRKVYVFYPVPELRKPVTSILSNAWVTGKSYQQLYGSTKSFYDARNQIIISHFQKSNYPNNVVFIGPAKKLCNDKECFATIDGKPLYFDSDHPSVDGARLLVSDIPLQE